ncbi:MAG: P-loop NTPase, partial [Alkalispirochaetaceae bacterium]
MAHIIPFASGKGGVGKTLTVANLGVALAQAGKTTILVDLDLGGSNLHTCLGVRNRHSGLGNFIYKQEESMESLVVQTEVPRLFMIPGDALLPGTANLPYFRKLKILEGLEGLVADYVLLDLGSGSAYNTLDFYLSSMMGIIVTTPETTAILNAYIFLKSALIRLVQRSFHHRSAERQVVNDFMQGKIEGTDLTVQAIVDRLSQLSKDSAELAKAQIEKFLPRVVLNMGRSPQDIALGGKLRQIVQNNLAVDVEYIGYLPHSPNMSRSILERQPAALKYPSDEFVQAIRTLANRLIEAPMPQAPSLYAENEDLFEIAEEAEELEAPQ